jgi:hypothetical protein
MGATGLQSCVRREAWLVGWALPTLQANT